MRRNAVTNDEQNQTEPSTPVTWPPPLTRSLDQLSSPQVGCRFVGFSAIATGTWDPVACQARAETSGRGGPNYPTVLMPVEGMNGYAKTDAYEGIEHAGNRRVRGIPTEGPVARRPNRWAPGHRQGTSTHPRPEQQPITNSPQHHKRTEGPRSTVRYAALQHPQSPVRLGMRMALGRADRGRPFRRPARPRGTPRDRHHATMTQTNMIVYQ